MSENKHDSQALIYEPLPAEHEQFVESMINQGAPEDSAVRSVYHASKATGWAIASALEQEHNATHDQLTGLLNRRGMEAGIQEMVKRGHNVGVLALDADKFKLVNDTYGHAAGDAVLKEMAEVITDTLRASDISAHEASRTGGDEFLIAVDLTTTENERRGKKTMSTQERLMGVVNRVQEAFSEHFKDDNMLKKIGFDVSIGAVARKPGMTPEELLKAADKLMYENKQRNEFRRNNG